MESDLKLWELLTETLIQSWRDKGCSEEIAQDNTAIELRRIIYMADIDAYFRSQQCPT